MPVAHKEDKREITIVLASTRAGTLLPPQLLYAGKTDQVHPTFRFTDGWDVFHTDRHWATTESTKRFAEVFLLPYVKQIREKLDIPELPAIILHDVHASHRDEALLKLFHGNNCHVRFVPANLTSELQPNDQLINRSFKSKLMHEYEDFYTSEFIRQFELHDDVTRISIDTRLVAIRNKHASWVVSAFNDIAQKAQMIHTAWTKAGLRDPDPDEPQDNYELNTHLFESDTDD